MNATEDQPTLVVLDKRRGGRPRAEEPGSRVSVWLPASTHDRLIKLANQKDVSVSSLVRTLLTLKISR